MRRSMEHLSKSHLKWWTVARPRFFGRHQRLPQKPPLSKERDFDLVKAAFR